MTSLKHPATYDLRVFPSPEEVATALAKDIIEESETVLLTKKQCVWALSGGSSILAFYDALKKLPDPGPDFWHQLIVCWVDERHVPHEHPESNFGNAYRYFWHRHNGCTFISVPWYPEPGVSAAEYQARLHEHGIDGKQGVDIMLLGMGADGHTASLFPQSQVLLETEKKIATVKRTQPQPYRITMTYPMINRSRSLKLLMYGRDKADTFRSALKSNDPLQYPVLGVEKNRLEIYSDQTLGEG